LLSKLYFLSVVNMGFETDRLKKQITFIEELLCVICHNLVDNPVQHAECETLFCKDCIEDWLTRDNTCPVDRKNLTTEMLRPPPRISRKMLESLEIRCDFLSRGCTNYETYENIKEHEESCIFNPKWENDYTAHLKEKLDQQQVEGLSLRTELTQKNKELVDLKEQLAQKDMEVVNMKEGLAQKDREVVSLKERLERRVLVCSRRPRSPNVS